MNGPAKGWLWTTTLWLRCGVSGHTTSLTADIFSLASPSFWAKRVGYAVNDNFLQNIILFSSEKPNTGLHRALWSIWKGLWLSRVVLLPFLLLPFALLFPMWKSPFNISPVRKSSLKGLRVALFHWACCTSQGYKTCLVAGGPRYPVFAKYCLANDCLNLQDIVS